MLKERRKCLGMSQRYLAEKLGISRGYLSKVERSKFSNVKVEFISKISDELILDPNEVFLFFYNSLGENTD